MTKPTGKRRGRPPGSKNSYRVTSPRKGVTEHVLSADVRRRIAHEYFLRLQVRILDTVMAMGSTRTADIKSVKLILGNKLVAEGQKQGWLQQKPDEDSAEADTDADPDLSEINAGDDDE